MRYKKFDILPEYSILADCKLVDDVWIDRKPRKCDIEYYVIYDTLNDNKRWIAENTIEECKATIDQFLDNVGLKENIRHED